MRELGHNLFAYSKSSLATLKLLQGEAMSTSIIQSLSAGEILKQLKLRRYLSSALTVSQTASYTACSGLFLRIKKRLGAAVEYRIESLATAILTRLCATATKKQDKAVILELLDLLKRKVQRGSSQKRAKERLLGQINYLTERYLSLDSAKPTPKCAEKMAPLNFYEFSFPNSLPLARSLQTSYDSTSSSLSVQEALSEQQESHLLTSYSLENSAFANSFDPSFDGSESPSLATARSLRSHSLVDFDTINSIEASVHFEEFKLKLAKLFLLQEPESPSALNSIHYEAIFLLKKLTDQLNSDLLGSELAKKVPLELPGIEIAQKQWEKALQATRSKITHTEFAHTLVSVVEDISVLFNLLRKLGVDLYPSLAPKPNFEPILQKVSATLFYLCQEHSFEIFSDFIGKKYHSAIDSLMLRPLIGATALFSSRYGKLKLNDSLIGKRVTHKPQAQLLADIATKPPLYGALSKRAVKVLFPRLYANIEGEFKSITPSFVLG